MPQWWEVSNETTKGKAGIHELRFSEYMARDIPNDLKKHSETKLPTAINEHKEGHPPD